MITSNVFLLPQVRKTQQVIAIMRDTNRTLAYAGRQTLLMPASKEQVEQQVGQIINYVNDSGDTAC